MSWSTFLKAHWGAIAATDLFTVEVVNPFGLVRYHLLFVIDIATRCVCIGGMTSDPNGEWMKQAARNLTDMWDGFLLGDVKKLVETCISDSWSCSRFTP